MANTVGKTIYFITGASGVGKTTLLDQLETKYKSKPWSFHHFDQIGVPSLDEMTTEFGSPSGWQEAKAYEWIDRLVHTTDGENIFLEGQVNLQFIRKGFSKNNFDNYQIVLIDCSDEEMERRLIYLRKQPELFNPDMKNWLKFLRKQSREFNATIINNSNVSKEELLRKFERATFLSDKEQ